MLRTKIRIFSRDLNLLSISNVFIISFYSFYEVLSSINRSNELNVYIYSYIRSIWKDSSLRLMRERDWPRNKDVYKRRVHAIRGASKTSSECLNLIYKFIEGFVARSPLSFLETSLVIRRRGEEEILLRRERINTTIFSLDDVREIFISHRSRE